VLGQRGGEPTHAGGSNVSGTTTSEPPVSLQCASMVP
jgi:hypothetical protein